MDHNKLNPIDDCICFKCWVFRKAMYSGVGPDCGCEQAPFYSKEMCSQCRYKDKCEIPLHPELYGGIMNKVTIRYRHRNTEGYVDREVTHIWIIDGVVFFEDIEKDSATLFIDRPAYFSVLLNPQQEVSNAVKTASTRVAGQRRETE